MAKTVGKKSARPVCRPSLARRVSTNDDATAVGELMPPGAMAARKAPRPSGCTRFVRREIAGAMPAICAMLLSRTMDGDLAALKLLLQMAVESQEAERGQERRGARTAGFARKILVGFKEWEARETVKRQTS